MDEDNETESLRKIFNIYDDKRVGYITAIQFLELIKAVSKYAPEIKTIDDKICDAVFAYYDIDEDGKLSFDEVYGWWASNEKFSFFIGNKAVLMKKARHLYLKYAERDNSNNIQGIKFESFEKMLDDLNIQHNDNTFDTIDTNDDGLISFVEFVKWLKWF